jgi:hypothetical protein
MGPSIRLTSIVIALGMCGCGSLAGQASPTPTPAPKSSFVGTWNNGDGSYSFSCSGAVSESGSSSLPGVPTISITDAGGTEVLADIGGCMVRFNVVDGATATADAGQQCSPTPIPADYLAWSVPETKATIQAGGLLSVSLIGSGPHAGGGICTFTEGLSYTR